MIEGAHDALLPAGPQAAALALLWWVLLATCVLVFVAVIVALAWALWHAPRGATADAPATPQPGRDARARRWVGGAVTVCAVLLFALLAASAFTDRALARLPLADAVHIELTGHQFWWEARYDDADPSRIFSTANELHVPVGRPVLLTLRADDVIHSFWVPSLHGKKDLIPGRVSTFAFRADHAGIYRGQCAEFCGWQHANMALLVIADEPGTYEQWAAAQRAPAPAPVSEEERRGRDLFVTSTCAMCHAVGGTLAQGQHAPDLTHLASRLTIAAGTLPNNAFNRAAWIVDPQQFKPGVNMPPHDFAPQDLAALGAFLGSLR